MTTPYVTQPATPIADTENGELRPHKLPPPQTFDLLPPLHGILARLLGPSSNSALSQLGALPDGTSTSNPLDNEAASIKGDSDKFLDIQHLGAASAGVKVRIQKARQAIKDLPDVDRTIEEQEQEIQELGKRIQQMKAVLARVGEVSPRQNHDNLDQMEVEI